MDGSVTVEFIISETGTVPEAVVIRSTNSGFNQAVLDAIRKDTFTPASRDGVSVRAVGQLDFYFTHGT
jgi:TonB family protein